MKRLNTIVFSILLIMVFVSNVFAVTISLKELDDSKTTYSYVNGTDENIINTLLPAKANASYVTGSTETALLTHTGNTTNPHGMTISNLPTLSGTNTFTGTNNFTGPVSLTDGTNTSTIIPPFRTDKSKCNLLVDFDNSLVDKTRGITPTGYSTANMWSDAWVNDSITKATATSLGGTFKTFNGDRGKFGGGFAVEESRTNLVYPDSTTTAGAWWLSVTNVTADATKPNPDGIVDGLVYRIDSNSDAYKIVGTAVALSNGSSITYSVWEKYEAGASLICISLSGGGDLATSAPASTISKWVRSSVTYTNSSGSSQNVLIRHYNTNGSKYQIWGHQFEVGSFPTSYIATTTAAVTRPAGALKYTVADFAYNAPFTLSCWRKETYQSVNAMMPRLQNSNDSLEFAIMRKIAGTQTFRARVNDDLVAADFTLPTFDTNWHLWTMVSNGTYLYFYYDATLITTLTISPGAGLLYKFIEMPPYGGSQNDNVVLLNYALTLAEIKQIYYSNQPVMCESSVKKEDITRTFAGDPNADFAPMYLNEMVWDSSNSKWYKSKGVLSNAAFDTGAWILLN